MTLHIPFDNSYARLPRGFFVRHQATPVHSPSLIAFNHQLAKDLGIEVTADSPLAEVFSGNQNLDGADPLAQLYAGHQFGQFSPQLGDGRALLLGEVKDLQGVRRDIQLKGSGPTPFSRRGDGRAWLGPVLREFIVSEAMHALGVPTTRALAAVRTGEPVLREAALPGAVLTRVASSHIRVGTFEVFASRNDVPALRALFDYARARHTPEAGDPHEFFDSVMARQAELVAQWMAIGFIHGVMNTDNCTISGETIDYGPCAFLDEFHPGRVFSSIDRQGRYAYAAQADIIVWNMAKLASALVPLADDMDEAVKRYTQQVHAMPDLIRAAWLRHFGAKLGLSAPTHDDAQLITELLTQMQQGQADFTNTFRALTDDQEEIPETLRSDSQAQAWHAKWRARIEGEPGARTLMAQSNPVLIPRNHRIEEVIKAAVEGDDAPFHLLHEALSDPFADRPEFADFRAPPKPEEVVPATFCGT